MAYLSELSASDVSLAFLAGLTQRVLQAQAPELQPLLQEILAEAASLTGARCSFFYSCRPEQQNWQRQAVWPAAETGRATHTCHSPVLAEALSAAEAGQPLALSTLRPPPETEELWQLLQPAADLQTWLVPMSAEGQLLGFLALGSAVARLTALQTQTLTALAGWLAVITARLAQRQHLTSQALLARISARFVQLHESRLEQAIVLSLEEIGAFFRADRAYLFRYDPLQKTYSLSHEWCARGVAPTKAEMQDLSFVPYTWLQQQFSREGQLVLSDVSRLPPEAEPEQALLMRQGVRSLLCRPLQIRQMPYGLIGVDAVQKPACWSAEERVAFERLAALMGEVLFRYQAEQTLNAYASMQRLLMQLATRLIHLPLAEIDTAMQEALADLGQYLGAEKAYIFDYQAETGMYLNSHLWSHSSVARASQETVGAVAVTDLGNWHLSQRPYLLASPADLPSREPLAGFVAAEGIQSLVAVPVRFQTEAMGFVAFATLRSRHHYSSQQISILRLFAQMLANIRQREQLQRALLDSRNQAEQASQAKSVFLANISHEIRTPLNGLIGFLEMLSATRLSPAQASYLEHAAASADNLLRLLNDILDFVRLGSNQLSLHSRPSNLSALLQQSLDALQPGALKKQLNLQLLLPAQMPAAVEVDPLRLQQILLNLLGNAIKFTEQGSVTLSLTFAETTVPADARPTASFEIRVQDTGPGIALSDQEKLFQPFSQVDTSATRRFGGSGLGLVISRQLAQRMGASLCLESRPGEGSCFILTLPAAFEWTAAEESAALRERPASEPERLVLSAAALQILIVEDHPVNRQLLQVMLQALFPAAQISEAFNGAEAVQAVEAQQHDLILMDIQMPVMDGYEATRRIRQINQTVPIVALSAATLAEEAQRSLAVGMNAYLSKPFRREQLSALLKGLDLREPEPVHFDAPSLLERLDGDMALARTLLDQALNLLAAEALDLAPPLDAAAAQRLRLQAHRIKGMAANLSLLALRDCAQLLEQRARQLEQEPEGLETVLQAARKLSAEMLLLQKLPLWPDDGSGLRV